MGKRQVAIGKGKESADRINFVCCILTWKVATTGFRDRAAYWKDGKGGKAARNKQDDLFVPVERLTPTMRSAQPPP